MRVSTSLGYVLPDLISGMIVVISSKKFQVRLLESRSRTLDTDRGKGSHIYKAYGDNLLIKVSFSTFDSNLGYTL